MDMALQIQLFSIRLSSSW